MPALKSKVPHLRNLHYNWFGSDICKVEGRRRDGFEAGDGGFDAVLQFSEGGFVVFEDGVGLLEDADAIPLYGVGEGLDLGRGDWWDVSFAGGKRDRGSVERKRGGGAHGLMSSRKRNVSMSSCFIPFSSA